MTKRILLILFFFLVISFGPAKGQSSSSSTRSVWAGTSLPAACQPTGTNIFYKSDTGALYTCTATNTWTIVAGGGGGGISGSGTTNTLAKFTGSTSIGNSILSESGSTQTLNGNLITVNNLGVANTSIDTSKYINVQVSAGTFGSGFNPVGVYGKVTGGGGPAGEHPFGLYGYAISDRDSLGSGGPIGVHGQADVNTGISTTIAVGFEGITNLSGTTATAYGLFNQVVAFSGSTVTTAYGSFNDIASVGTIVNATGLYAKLRKISSGNITTSAIGVDINDWSGITPTTSIALHIGSSVDVGTTKYAIKSDSTSQSVFQGQVGINLGSIASPTMLAVGDTSTSSPRGLMSWQSNDGTDGARFHLRKSRGTFASPTVIVTGDTLGRIVSTGYDGSNFLEMASIDFLSTGTIAATRVPTQIVFKTATDAAPSVLTTALTLGADQKATFAGDVLPTSTQSLGSATLPWLSTFTGNTTQYESVTQSAGLITHAALGSATNISIALTPKGTGAVLLRDGSVTAPALAFASSPTTGIYSSIGTVIQFSSAGNVRMNVGNQVSVDSLVLGITAFDVALFRNATAVVEINNNTSGRWGGLKVGFYGAATNAIANGLTVGTRSSGTPAAGLGAGIAFTNDDSTTANQPTGQIASVLTNATHATVAADLIFYTVTGGAAPAEGMRLTSAGLIRNPTISSDVGLTDTAVCQDTTNHEFHSGSGAAGICLGTSSLRFKHDVSDLGEGLDTILKLRPRNFFYNKGIVDSGLRRQYGFIAEEANLVAPGIVVKGLDGRPNSVDYGALFPILTKAIQEMQVEVLQLRQEIKQLKENR